MNTHRSEFTAARWQNPPLPAVTARLRLLATTDIHMQLLGYDYVADAQTGNHGLAGIATLIDAARHEAEEQRRGCVLFDNGDVLQGGPLGEWLARNPVTETHPIVAGFNRLGYDAIGVGNHDLDHGLPYLRQVASLLDMPMIRSNLRADNLHPLQESALIECTLPAPDGGEPLQLRLGVLSVLPAETAVWNRDALKDKAEIEGALPCLRRAVPALRARGADLVVLLAHLGIKGSECDALPEESAFALAQVPGVDAIITGHTHRRFPGLDHVGLEGVDAESGTLARRPAIMPGFAGSDLAVLDLDVRRDRDGNWQVIDHKGRLRPNTAATPAHADLKAAMMPAHLDTLHRMSQKVGNTDKALHNYFSLSMPTPTSELTAQAKARVVRAALQGTPDATLPLLVATAAHTAGGRGGPDNYLHIAQGTVYRRHIVGLNPYANHIQALRVTGADLRRYLERSALVFNRLHPDRPDQLLTDPDHPAFNFDTVFGLSYRIDPTRPSGERISCLLHGNDPVEEDQRFVLVTNQFRAAGGGGFGTFDKHRIALQINTPIEDALTDALAYPDDTPWGKVHIPWRFSCAFPVKAILHTAPAARDLLHDAAHLRPEPCGVTHDGFVRLRLTL